MRYLNADEQGDAPFRLSAVRTSRWWFLKCLFIFTPIWGYDPIWRAYFSNGWLNHHLDLFGWCSFQLLSFQIAGVAQHGYQGWVVESFAEAWKSDPETRKLCQPGSHFSLQVPGWHFLVQLVVRSFTIFQGFATTARDTTSCYDSLNFPAEVMQKPNSLCQSAVHSKRFFLFHNLPCLYFWGMRPSIFFGGSPGSHLQPNSPGLRRSNCQSLGRPSKELALWFVISTTSSGTWDDDLREPLCKRFCLLGKTQLERKTMGDVCWWKGNVSAWKNGVILVLDRRWFIHVIPKKMARRQFAERKLLENFFLINLSCSEHLLLPVWFCGQPGSRDVHVASPRTNETTWKHPFYDYFVGSLMGWKQKRQLVIFGSLNLPSFFSLYMLVVMNFTIF